ncbi:putative alpha/beta hydrolase family esterase [Pontibacter aydingkolensis]|uniref:Alpha/beta fold hydrolase n=1 Tax=Pontibacter aydingkolensis TaxID=1911536 RepID=A0ABS7CP71_9BACT|nr:alpha/beta fold hydrolase [Pontibacter aydingkolensis]MBW7465563.1 alpha/beta fold hydrolase [Pontibacter aydingkolensis]
MTNMQVIHVPGLGNSGPEHWQSIWQSNDPASIRVQQADWDNPVCRDWVEELQRTISAVQDKDILLVAHSLGCLTVAHWAQKYTAPIKSAFLVAPPEVEINVELKEVLDFAPFPKYRLPFKSMLVASADDDYLTIERAAYLANLWGSEFVNVGAIGHINTYSNIGAWEQGQKLFEGLKT